MVALDLRGHGMSDVPSTPEQFSDGDLWAEDNAAIIAQLALVSPILVGWSYGGFIISDYVRKYGDSKLGGINFVAAAVVLGPKAFGTLIGPGFLNHAPGACQPDLPTSIAAIRNLLRACIVKPVSQDIQETTLAYNMVVRPEDRGALIQRELDFSPVLDGLKVPVLVTLGRSDSVVLPAMSEHILGHCKKATASWFDDVGHCPFLEEPERFNRELA